MIRNRQRNSPVKAINVRGQSKEISDRLPATTFATSKVIPRDGGQQFQSDPHWRDYLLLITNTCHGDNGAGRVQATKPSWTGLVAKL